MLSLQLQCVGRRRQMRCGHARPSGNEWAATAYAAAARGSQEGEQQLAGTGHETQPRRRQRVLPEAAGACGSTSGARLEHRAVRLSVAARQLGGSSVPRAQRNGEQRSRRAGSSAAELAAQHSSQSSEQLRVQTGTGYQPGRSAKRGSNGRQPTAPSLALSSASRATRHTTPPIPTYLCTTMEQSTTGVTRGGVFCACSTAAMLRIRHQNHRGEAARNRCRQQFSRCVFGGISAHTRSVTELHTYQRHIHGDCHRRCPLRAPKSRPRARQPPRILTGDLDEQRV